MITTWFDTKEVDVLADRLVRELLERIPPTKLVSESGDKRAQKKELRTREIVLRQAAEFAGSHKLNIYQKARLANRFKWALRDAGYPKEMIDQLSYELAAVTAIRRGSDKQGR